MPPPHKHRRIPSSAIAAFIRHDEVDAILEPFVLDPRDREWLLRCILDAGPAHHRGSNFVLLELLGAVLERLPPVARETDPGRVARVPMRVPQHPRPGHGGPHGDAGPRHHRPPHDHDHEHERDADAFFPIGVPAEVLDHLAPPGSREQAAMIDCLTDGPPQHALANAAMVHLIGEILARLPEPAATPEPAPSKPRKKREGS